MMLLRNIFAAILYMCSITDVLWPATLAQEPKKNVKVRDEGKTKKIKASRPIPDPITRRIELPDGSTVQRVDGLMYGWIDMGCGDSIDIE